jgi:hypothetical protein
LRRRETIVQGFHAPPTFVVRVASKGLRQAVSLLFATLAGRFINVAAKGLMGKKCWRESMGLGREDFVGVRRTTCPSRFEVSGQAWFEGTLLSERGRRLRPPEARRANEGSKEVSALGKREGRLTITLDFTIQI